MDPTSRSPNGLATPRTAYARSGDVHIAYQTVGEGPLDLLVAPGFVSHLDLQWTMPGFAKFVRGLNRLGRVILFDKRGTGLSDPAPDADRFDLRVNDIEAVLDAVGSERAVLFGVSEGGPLAALFAASHPERVRALVLYGTFARGSLIPEATLDRFRHAVDHWGDGLTADIFVSPGDVGPMVRTVTGLFERASTPPGLARALLSSIRECDVRPALGSISCPTLVVHRSDDPFAHPGWGRELADGIVGSRFVELPGDSHVPWIGDSTEVVAEIEEFLTGGRSDPSELERVLGTVLFTDIVGSTSMAARMGDDDWARLLDAHHRVVSGVIAAYRGNEIDRAGDGFFAFFDAPARAVECARALTFAVKPLGLEIRAGLHTGTCRLVDGDGLAGITVHIGARIGSRATASEVLVSRQVADLCTGTQLRFVSVGPADLHGVPEPVEIMRLLPDGPASPAADTGRRLRRLDRLTLGVARGAPALLRGAARLAGARS